MIADLSIIIPVFNALDETVACMDSILKSDAANARIWLLDDCSHQAVERELRSRFGALSNVTIISHFRNRGYTRNIDFGVRLAETEFVCVLNSDTLVPKIWATHLLAHLHDRKDVAAVGPLSNAASYQSVPEIHDENGGFSDNSGLGFKSEELEWVNAFLRHMFSGETADVPVLNGFCTIFRRSAVLKVGGFDYKSFPEGYGEENDLCVRLKAAGYRLNVILDTFIHHQKSKSFGKDRKVSLSTSGAKMLSEKYGPTLLQSFSKILNSIPMINLVNIILGQAVRACQEINSSSCITLRGPGTFRVDGTNVEKYDASEVDFFTYSLKASGALLVTVPMGDRLNIIREYALLSAIIGLALHSYRQPIFLTSWIPDSIAPEMLESISKIRFGMNQALLQ